MTVPPFFGIKSISIHKRFHLREIANGSNASTRVTEAWRNLKPVKARAPAFREPFHLCRRVLAGLPGSVRWRQCLHPQSLGFFGLTEVDDGHALPVDFMATM